MSKDVVVVVSLDNKPVTVDVVDILLISTEKKKDLALYTSLDSIAKDWTKDSSAYKMAHALFEQGGATPAPERLIRKVAIVGFEPPEAPEDLIVDIMDFQDRNNDWYIFMTDQTDDDYIEALAEFAAKSEPTERELSEGAEDRRKFYIGQTNSKDLSVNKTRTAVIYVDNLAEQADAAWAGAVLAWYPRGVTWKFKMPQGVSVPELTQAEIGILEGNHINYVTNEYKKNYIKHGCCTDGSWCDAVIGGDWIAKTMREKLYDVFITNPVVPYTDAGFTLIGAAVFEALNEATGHGIIAENPESGLGEYTVVIPKRSGATEAQAKERIMPDIPWSATLGGAIHGVKIKGVLKVTLP